MASQTCFLDVLKMIIESNSCKRGGKQLNNHLGKPTCKWRGRRLSSRSTGTFSSPSGNTVWVVKEKILHTMSHALFQSKCSSSTSTLITSAIAREGWVSFSCRATYISGKAKSDQWRQVLVQVLWKKANAKLSIFIPRSSPCVNLHVINHS